METKTSQWIQPPAPQGKGGSRPGGYTATGLTNTELGDSVERALCSQLGFTSLLDGVRQGTFDVTRDGVVWEVKAVTTASTEYKIRWKKAEFDRKCQARDELGLVAGVVLAVVEDDGTVWVYARRELGAFRLTDSFEFVGRVQI
jgi:hypothetical protein